MKAIWATLLGQLDFSRDGMIEPEEFIRGRKETALKKPVSVQMGTCLAHEAIAGLEATVNHHVKELCRSIYNWVTLTQQQQQMSRRA